MAKVEIPFVGGAYTMRSLQLDAQNCMNWYMTLDPLGKYKSALLPRGGLRLYVDDSTIDAPIFVGGGINDLESTGSFSGITRKDFWVKIDVAGTPDRFIVSEDGGVTWFPTQVPITGDYQNLSFGVQIKFTATTGHTVGNYWIISAHSENSVRGMFSLNNVLYVVIDNKFYLYYSGRERVLKGYLNTSRNPVRILANNYQIAIFDGQFGYVYQIIATQYHEADTFFIIDRSSSTVSTPVFSGSGANNMSITAVYTGGSSKNYIVKIDGARSTFSVPAFSGLLINDLSTSGVFAGDINKTYKILIDSVPTLSQVTFTGTGLNDFTLGGNYTGNGGRTFVIKIDGVGNPNTFKWSNDGGTSWAATGIPITVGMQLIQSNIYVKFSTATGHTLDDQWAVVANDTSTARDTFRWSNDNGATWKQSYVSITGGVQTLESGVQIKFANSNGHGVNDYWTFYTILTGISPDTFKWSNDDGSTWIATNVPITTELQLLEDGIYVSFISNTAHALNDSWSFLAEFSNSFFPPIVPTYQDGYGVYPKQNSQRFYYTAIEDFSRVDALAYESAITYADNIAGAASMNQELYIIGTDSMQLYHTSADPDLPFASRTNLIINYGCIAPYTIQVGSDNILFMLARNKSGDRIIITVENYDVKTISTEPLMDELMSYSKVDDAFAYIIESTTNIFYIISFPSADKTWVYNLKMDQWAQWSSTWDNTFPESLPTRQGIFKGSCHAVFDGKNIVGDIASGKLYVFTDSYNLDNDKYIKYQRTSPHLYGDDDWITVNSLIIDVQRGETLVNSPPKLMLQVSRDGGQTWGSEMWRTSGDTGQYTYRAIWTNLGTARNFTFRLTITDSAYNVILGAVADIEGNE
jgi:hypothetical protein